MQRWIRSFFLASALGSGAGPAASYDIDCAILLCLGGGFPPGPVCAAAHVEMIRRITPWPVKAPLGPCRMETGPGDGNAARRGATLDTTGPDFAWLDRTRILWWRSTASAFNRNRKTWSWSVQSCDRTNEDCQIIGGEAGALTPWPVRIDSKGGLPLDLPRPTGSGWFRSRAVSIEYGDHDGRMQASHWFHY